MIFSTKPSNNTPVQNAVEGRYGYKGKRYPVSELIEYVKHKNLEPVAFDLNSNIVTKCDIGSMWGECIYADDKVTVKDKLPLNPIMLAKDHIDRILKADTSYPIIVWKGRRVLDGFHRVVKAIYEGKSSIQAYELTEDMLDELTQNKENQNV